MEPYPEAVAKIAEDYLDRVSSRLDGVPFREREEFLKEIRSHVYEAYQQEPGADDVQRILAVLRNLGEPTEVVSDRLPGTMLRSGTKRTLPLHVLGGMVVALFGIPLGFGGVAVLAGMLVLLAGMVATYFAAVGMVFLAGAFCLLLGLVQTYQPELWDRLLAFGVIQMDPDVAQFMDALAPSGQALLLIVLASVLVAAGLGMLALGRHLMRGLRFLSSLVFERLRRTAQSVRRKLRERGPGTHTMNHASFARR